MNLFALLLSKRDFQFLQSRRSAHVQQSLARQADTQGRQAPVELCGEALAVGAVILRGKAVIYRCVVGSRQGKQSFFEKKDQKAFVCSGRDSQTKVFCFFSSEKKTLPS